MFNKSAVTIANNHLNNSVLPNNPNIVRTYHGDNFTNPLSLHQKLDLILNILNKVMVVYQNNQGRLGEIINPHTEMINDLTLEYLH